VEVNRPRISRIIVPRSKLGIDSLSSRFLRSPAPSSVNLRLSFPINNSHQAKSYDPSVSRLIKLRSMPEESDAYHKEAERTPAAAAAAALHDDKKHLLLSPSDFVATIKLPLITPSLANHNSLSIRARRMW
jgi:hypothetical protein